MNKTIKKLGVAGVIDLETTGFSPITEEILELSLVLFSFNYQTGEVIEIVDEYSGLREPEVPIGRGASRVHGIYKKDVLGMTLDEKRIVTMFDAAEYIIAHNARFDYSFMIQLSNQLADKPWLCSMNGIGWRKKGLASRALQYLIEQHGIEVARKHRARDDAMATLSLISQQDANSNYYLLELLRSKPINYARLAAKEAAAAAK